jgi:ribosomal protein L7/L12
MEKFSLKKCRKFAENLRHNPEKDIAMIVVRTLEAGMVDEAEPIDDKRLDEITARNNNRINDCMELVMTLFRKGHVDKIQAIGLVRVLENVSLVDAKEVVDAWDTKCKHEWVAHVNGDIKCKHCPAINPAPDPIIEVYNKYMSKKVCWYDAKTSDKKFDNLLNEAKDFWRAIVKYTEGKGKK